MNTQILSSFLSYGDVGLEMKESTIAVKLGKDELSYLIDYLIMDLRAWSEKGLESVKEKEQFERIVSVVSKLREAMRETTTLFL